MMKRLTLTASTLRARDADEKARLAHAVETHVWPWLEAGRVRPIIDRTFPLERAGEAHQWLERGSQFGKVVCSPMCDIRAAIAVPDDARRASVVSAASHRRRRKAPDR